MVTATTHITQSGTGNRYSAEFKHQLIEEYKAGGTTILELHQKYGVSQGSIQQWLVKAGVNSGKRSDKLSSCPIESEDAPRFMEVTLPRPSDSTSAQEVSIHFPSGVELRFHCGVSPEYISSVVATLGY